MRFLPIILFFFCSVTVSTVFGQKKQATVSGKVVDENENPLAKVSILILGRESGIVSSDSGTFKLTVPADKAFALVFSFTGYKSEQRNFLLSENEQEYLVLRMERGSNNFGKQTGTRRDVGV